MENQINQILYEINERAAKYYCSLLLSNHGKAAISWLNGVGLSEDTIKQFSLGYTGKERCGLVGYLNDLGYRNEQILEAGLADSTERGIEDKFIDRIMIPIKDEEYRVIGFLGRRIVYGSSIYLITPDNSILEKNRNLFGLDHIREANDQFVILCEGVFDVMVMNQAGFGMAASLLGTRFTMEHAKQIKKYTQNVIICFDTDEYGKKEAERVIGILNQAEITAQNFDLSPYRDSLEYISREGGTAFGRQLKIALTDKDESYRIKELLEETTRTAVFSNEYKSNGNYKIYEVTMKKALGNAEKTIRITEVSPFEHQAPIEEIPYVESIVKTVRTCYPDVFLSDLCNEGLLNWMMSENDTVSGLLETLCEEGLIMRYSNFLPLHRERLAREMEIINQKDFAAGFLIVHDFIKFARSKNLMIFPGCGVFLGSLVAYCLGITGVDPLKEDLIFERYLNSENETHSYGIRIDVEKGAKDLIYEYISKKYGKGMPKLLEIADINIKESVELSIIKETLENILENKGVNVNLSAIDKNDPDVYKYLCSGATEGVFYFDKVDPHTYTTGRWQDNEMKWHEFHPPIVMENEGLFKAIQPKTMNELMAFLCLDRRLPKELVERYVHNKNNPDCITYECPDLEPILEPTYGCLVYQEQVMWILQVLGGFSPEQSDLCRRALSKKQSSVIDRMKKQFVEGATSTVPGYFTNLIDEDTAVVIYDKLSNGAPYCFNKAHAVTEAMKIYDMVWLKYYYSSEFREVAEKYKGVKSDVLP